MCQMSPNVARATPNVTSGTPPAPMRLVTCRLSGTGTSPRMQYIAPSPRPAQGMCCEAAHKIEDRAIAEVSPLRLCAITNFLGGRLRRRIRMSASRAHLALNTQWTVEEGTAGRLQQAGGALLASAGRPTVVPTDCMSSASMPCPMSSKAATASLPSCAIDLLCLQRPLACAQGAPPPSEWWYNFRSELGFWNAV